MLKPSATLFIFCLMVTPSYAVDPRLEASLRKLDPAERFTQLCDVEAMARIRHDATAYRPDRALADAISPTERDGDRLTGAGGAFRSAGHWYRYSFSCEASPDRMTITAFDYKIGPMIPEAQWAKFGLWQ
ncbi:MAG: DUF930 domain-containing protein [Chelatococcus sp.]|jgi:hypothetical protein|uniref:DUF930 domain-containing protein n=1 Tax=unclassified Chelatococcus TaxID=2638111 RepID=UPI001BCCF3F5|nr:MULTISPECIES: DUF930 domain-containing protein [unclassified Chelatococcus]CAH1664402.1 conserved exported hypothetical protein [Hyphomicrobiales bacterium]MBS7741697.1 DUF930 domain-containing protein [Chelatococcus sp. HY11]MBX3538708.1 DUF930 domain-containing protein [Chelatococcus sp.]MBX3544284.1 DUF930 domain-containing protein [Chelatococcus sp.]MCO5079393.1 DUF930 domain-containing protein [Chelatococcus sp.]